MINDKKAVPLWRDLKETFNHIKYIVMKKIFALAFVAAVSIVFGACDGNAPSQPNVFISIADNGKHQGFYLMYLSYVSIGDNGLSGKNILGERKGTLEFKGMTYECWSIPKRKCDLYFEYYQGEGWSPKKDNERKTINLKDNEWVRISWDLAESYATQPGILQGSGTMY